MIEGISDLEPGSRVSACIRPEGVTIALTPSPTSARNSFSGTITSMASSGPLVRVGIDCGFPLVALITSRSAEDLELRAGIDGQRLLQGDRSAHNGAVRGQGDDHSTAARPSVILNGVKNRTSRPDHSAAQVYPYIRLSVSTVQPENVSFVRMSYVVFALMALDSSSASLLRMTEAAPLCHI